MSPRQIQIKQFELEQIILLDNLKDFIRNGGKMEDLMADDPLYVKWCEIKGIVLEDNDGAIDSDILGLNDKLKAVQTPEERAEVIKKFMNERKTNG